jgi:hypothetical protein
MPDTRTVRATPNTLYRDLVGEGVLLQLDSGEYFGLDEVGNRVWQLIAEVGNLDDIRERMLADFDVERDVLSADLDQFVSEMVEKHLVEVR